MTNPTIIRICDDCHQSFVSSIHRHLTICELCNKEKRRIRRAIAARERYNRSEQSKEQGRAACRAWKKANPSRYKASQKAWYERNKKEKSKKVAAYIKARRAADPEFRKLTNERATKRAKRMCGNPRFERQKANSALKRYYGITIDDLEAMRKAQDGRCKLCAQQRKLTVDHDHQTGKVRDLLCHGCNQGLGQFGDSIVRLQGAVDYLLRHQNSIH